MPLFSALSELVGGAILASAPACDLALPAEAIVARERFASFLASRDEMRELRSLVEGLGGAIWVGADTRGLAEQDLEEHVKAAAAIVSELRPPAALLAELAAAARLTDMAAAAPERPVSVRIALDLVDRARLAGVLAGTSRTIVTTGPLREEVILFLIDSTFSELGDSRRMLLRFGQALADFASEWAPTVEVAGGIAALGISRAFVLQLEQLGGAAFLADLGERFGLAERAVRRVVQLVDGQTLEPEGRIARLEALGRWLADARSQLTRPANDDSEVRRLKQAAATALADGDFETAMDALRGMRRELREVRRRTEERLQDEAVALRAHMFDEAKATARLAELTEARGEHAAAADLFGEAALALPRADRETAWRFNLQRADALLRHARERNDTSALGEALAGYGQLVRAAAETLGPKALAEACLGHGDALALAGAKEAGDGRLRDAITIYQKALELIGREPSDDLRVRGLVALARALARLGDRDGSVETSRQAADAFRLALDTVPADGGGMDKASLLMGLGSVLLTLEERAGDAQVLAEAVDRYQAALGHLDRETDTERWGEAQLSLGLALLGAGESNNDIANLEAGVTAFQACLEVTARVRNPRRWALAQLNLGNALAAIGERDPTGTAHLDAAVAAYTAALEELLAEAEPVKRAITQMNLGTALIRLGEKRDKRRNWLSAAAALVPALEVFEAHGADDLAEITRQNLRRFQESWDSFISPGSGTGTVLHGDVGSRGATAPSSRRVPMAGAG